MTRDIITAVAVQAALLLIVSVIILLAAAAAPVVTDPIPQRDGIGQAEEMIDRVDARISNIEANLSLTRDLIAER
jgi:hypothetical protein